MIYYDNYCDTLQKVNGNLNAHIDFHSPVTQSVVNSGQGHVCVFSNGQLTYITYQYGLQKMDSYLANKELNIVLSWL